MNKTHVPDLPITDRQCHNRQVAFHFCAIRSVGSSVGTRAGMSAGTRNVVRFFPVTPEKRELALGNHKT
jgi:hypothetical protein